MAQRFDLNKFIDEKLDKIAGAGSFLGKAVGMFGRHTSKIIIGFAVLAIFGIAVFVWSFVQGMGKRK